VHSGINSVAPWSWSNGLNGGAYFKQDLTGCSGTWPCRYTIFVWLKLNSVLRAFFSGLSWKLMVEMETNETQLGPFVFVAFDAESEARDS
jgi:hypothetical protein